MSDLDPQEMPNLPADHPFRVKYITDVDCMIALATTKNNFDSHYKKHLKGWTRKGSWTLTTLEDFERMMIRVDQKRKESRDENGSCSDEDAELENLPADHPLRQHGIMTDVDLMLALGCTRQSFDRLHKPHLNCKTVRGKWSLIDSAEAAEYVRGLMGGREQ